MENQPIILTHRCGKTSTQISIRTNLRKELFIRLCETIFQFLKSSHDNSARIQTPIPFWRDRHLSLSEEKEDESVRSFQTTGIRGRVTHNSAWSINGERKKQGSGRWHYINPEISKWNRRNQPKWKYTVAQEGKKTSDLRRLFLEYSVDREVARMRAHIKESP